MDYFNAFWTGGLICALVQILLDKTRAAARPCHGSSRLQRCPFKLSRDLSAVCEFRRCRCHGSPARFRAHIMERYAKSNLRRWLSWIIYRWFYCLRPRGLCRFDLFISVQYDLPPANERLR